jgi:hypothetical protein
VSWRALLTTAVAVAAAAAPANAATIKWTPYGTPGENGWYASDVYVNWSVSDETPPVTDDHCPRSIHLTANTTGTQVSCSITDGAGQSSAKTPPIKIDQTPPGGIAAAPARSADVNGWYNHPVDIVWSGTDATSGIASCTAMTYAGPDSADSQAMGSCRDRAGNSASSGFTLNYDASAPALSTLGATPGNRRVVLTWAPSFDTVLAEVVRSPGLLGAASSTVYSGPAQKFTDPRVSNGRTYRYVVTTHDPAGNVASAGVRATPSGLTPPDGKRLTRPPTLRWPKAANARYYNVQLWRNHRKVLSVWPRAAHVKLHRTWTYRGHRRRFTRGPYRWYVWPGEGARSAERYGGLIGRSTFTVVR